MKAAARLGTLTPSHVRPTGSQAGLGRGMSSDVMQQRLYVADLGTKSFVVSWIHGDRLVLGRSCRNNTHKYVCIYIHIIEREGERERDTYAPSFPLMRLKQQAMPKEGPYRTSILTATSLNRSRHHNHNHKSSA